MPTRNSYFINQIQTESFFWTSAAFSYEISDPALKSVIMRTTEPKLGWFTKLCRIDRRYRGHTPFDVTIVAGNGDAIVNMKRGMAFLLSKVDIFDEKKNLIGVLKQKFSPIHAKLDMLDAGGTLLFQIKGDWADWDFKLVDPQGRQLATLSKGDGEGLLTELLTTKDSYHLSIDSELDPQSPLRRLFLASAIAVDIACNE